MFKQFISSAMLTCFLLVISGCGGGGLGSPDKSQTLSQARKGFQTKLVRQETSNSPVDQPDHPDFRLVKYPTINGDLPAYLATPSTKDSTTSNEPSAAIIWITGGDCNTIGDVWSDASSSNDQTAAAYRKAGLVMMFPSLRGGNENPGYKESFYGEVDDVIAAADYLAKQPGIDPNRIYLGGHSTGGTLVLLVSECTDRFRAVFSFGPVEDIRYYGKEFMPFDQSDRQEVKLRAPYLWLHSIKSPTFVFEGTSQGNFDSLRVMEKATDNPAVHFFGVQNANHFDVLAPVNLLIASKIRRDTEPTCNLKFTKDDANEAFKYR